MKTAAKVFLILNIIAGVALLIGGLAYAAYCMYGYYTNEGEAEMIVLIIPLLLVGIIGFSAALAGLLLIIFNSYALKKIRFADSKKEVIAAGVLCLLFGGILPGIFILCTKESDFNDGYIPEGEN